MERFRFRVNGLVSVTAADEDAVTGNRFCTFALFIMWVMNKFKLMNLYYLKLPAHVGVALSPTCICPLKISVLAESFTIIQFESTKYLLHSLSKYSI